jgi:hypothetical protein
MWKFITGPKRKCYGLATITVGIGILYQYLTPIIVVFNTNSISYLCTFIASILYCFQAYLALLFTYVDVSTYFCLLITYQDQDPS